MRDIDGTILGKSHTEGALRSLGLRWELAPWRDMPPPVEGGRRLIHAIAPAHLATAMSCLHRLGADLATMRAEFERAWREVMRNLGIAGSSRDNQLQAHLGEAKHMLSSRLDGSPMRFGPCRIGKSSVCQA